MIDLSSIDRVVCPWCGASLSIDSQDAPFCSKQHKRLYDFERARREKNGLCALCGLCPPAIGLKVCSRCSKELSTNFKKVREFAKGDPHGRI